MNAFDLHQVIDYFGSAGMILSPEEKAKLQTSLTILKDDMRFYKINFWGKVVGTQSDYFICHGFPKGTKNEMEDKMTLYTQDCMKWALMPEVTEELEFASNFPFGRFTGDPATVFNSAEIENYPFTNSEESTPEAVVIKEEDRLSCVVKQIDHDVGIIPRGAYLRTGEGNIIPNKNYEGLSVTESARLTSYYHFREAEKLPSKPLRLLASLDKSIDYLDPISDDVPKDGWAIIFDRGSGLVHVKSLLWPGYVCYNVPDCRKFGSLYYGLGIKNIDLPFML